MQTATIISLRVIIGVSIVLFLWLAYVLKKLWVYRAALKRSEDNESKSIQKAENLMASLENCRRDKDSAWSYNHEIRKSKGLVKPALLNLFKVDMIHADSSLKSTLIIEAESKEEILGWLRPWDSNQDKVNGLRKTSLEDSPFPICNQDGCNRKHIFYVRPFEPNGAVVRISSKEFHYAPAVAIIDY